MSEPLIWGGLVYALGFGLLVQRKRVLDTPTAKALSAAIGRAELSGTARGDPPEPSLVTGAPYACWQVELYRRVPNGKGGRTMKVIARNSSRAGHFWVEDASGRVPVLAEGAHWWLDRATELRNRRGDAISERARQWVQAATGRDWDDGEMKIVERRLEDGGPVYLLGTLSAASEVLRPTSQQRKHRPRSAVSAIALLLRNMFTKPVPPDDAISRAVARVREGGNTAEVEDARRELPDWLRANESVVMWRGAQRDPFLIANCAENRLAQRLARWGFATMGLGTVLILSGVWRMFR